MNKANAAFRVLFKSVKLIMIMIVVALLIFGFGKYTKKCLMLAKNNKISRVFECSRNKIFFMGDFTCIMDITYLANGIKSAYQIRYTKEAKPDDKGEMQEVERLEYLKPEKFKSMVIESTPLVIKHLNPYITKHLTYYTDKSRNYNELLLTSFKRNYMLSEDAMMQETEKSLIYETKVLDGSYYFNRHRLTVDKEKDMPVMLEILSEDGIVIAKVEYSDFTWLK